MTVRLERAGCAILGGVQGVRDMMGVLGGIREGAARGLEMRKGSAGGGGAKQAEGEN